MVYVVISYPSRNFNPVAEFGFLNDLRPATHFTQQAHLHAIASAVSVASCIKIVNALDPIELTSPQSISNVNEQQRFTDWREFGSK